jgi:predicted ATPase
MLIRRLKVSGLLSFGPQGIDLPLEGLNVLIGPNGSGKSNLLEVLALLKAAPSNLPDPVKEMGGIGEWLWKGPSAPKEARIEAIVEAPSPNQPLRHGLTIAEHGGRFELADESIETEAAYPDGSAPVVFYDFRRGNPRLNYSWSPDSNPSRDLLRDSLKPEQSILSQFRDPESYPALTWLQRCYEQIYFFRNWSFGTNAILRRGQSAHGRSDFLHDGGENLALVLLNLYFQIRPEMLHALGKLYDGIEDLSFQTIGGSVQIYLSEKGGRKIPATRLSDGTLRYLCLLTILLHPEPPPLIALEEPELGLHPDVIPHIAKLLVDASQRTQLVVTTHSRLLVDAMTDHPSSVVVCSKENGESRLERLDEAALKEWLEKYSLGDLWSMGELGGNRW